MIKSKIKDNRKHTLESFLNSFERYLIPSFQRKYSWGKKNVAELWNSILTNEPNYYIGTIVGIQSIDPKTGGQVIEIIDGQQRITTLSLFCLALRNYILEESNKKIKDPQGKAEYFERFLSSTNTLRDSSVKNIRLKFTKQVLNNVYEGLVNSEEDIYDAINDKEIFNELSDTQQVFINNYQKCLSLIKEHIKSDTKKDINEIITEIGTRLANIEFIAIITESDTDTYQLFEGLNNTAKPLSVVDLTKNAVFKSVNSKFESERTAQKVEELWEQLESDFDVVNIKWLDHFLRHQWISENGYISSSQLFESIKDKKLKNKSPAVILEYIKKLREDARFYIGLRNFDPIYLGRKFNSDSPKIDIRRYREDILEKLEFMKILGLGQIYEVLLALYKKFESTQYYTSKQFFKDLEKLWIFSFAITYSSISPSKYEKDFADFSLEITKYQGKNLDRVSQKFYNELYKKIKNSREDFVDLLSSNLRFKEDSGRKKIIRYVLYIHYGGKFSVDKKHKLKKESIDHIFPKNKNVWDDFELSNHIHMIGNLCLLDSGDNGKLQDILPTNSYKIKVYKEDPFKYNAWITKKFEKFEKSPTDTIEQRTNDIANDMFDYIDEMLKK